MHVLNKVTLIPFQLHPFSILQSLCPHIDHLSVLTAHDEPEMFGIFIICNRKVGHCWKSFTGDDGQLKVIAILHLTTKILRHQEPIEPHLPSAPIA